MSGPACCKVLFNSGGGGSMKCFTHPGADAVGSCKHCCKGVCTQCASDTGIGVVCSANCAEEVKAIRAMVDRNKKAYPMAAKTHSRNAVWFALLAVFMIVFGMAAGLDSCRHT